MRNLGLALAAALLAVSCSAFGLSITPVEHACRAIFQPDMLGATLAGTAERPIVELRDGRAFEARWDWYRTRPGADGYELLYVDGNVVARSGDEVDLGAAFISGRSIDICSVDPHDPALLERMGDGR
jgi:hypothetical protein